MALAIIVGGRQFGGVGLGLVHCHLFALNRAGCVQGGYRNDTNGKKPV
jgi:hypothetical protein